MTGPTGTGAPPPAAHELFRRVQAAASGTPYVVTPTTRGFDVSLDIVDAQWFGLFNKAGLQRLYVHHVAVDDVGTYTITDESLVVEWVAGVPQATGSSERIHGRVVEFGAQKVWAFDEQGRFGVQADYRFNSEEGRDLITGVAGQLGLKQRRGAAERTGLYVGAVAAVATVIGLIVMVVLALTGHWS